MKLEYNRDGLKFKIENDFYNNTREGIKYFYTTSEIEILNYEIEDHSETLQIINAIEIHFQKINVHDKIGGIEIKTWKIKKNDEKTEIGLKITSPSDEKIFNSYESRMFLKSLKHAFSYARIK